MASTLVDLVKISANSTGTGAITLGGAVAGYRGVEALTNGEVYSYSIQQGSAWEYGRGTYLASTNQLVRAPLDSSDGGAAISIKTGAAIAFVALSEDLDAVQLSTDAVSAAEQVAIDSEQVAIDRTIVEAAAATVTAGQAVYPNAYATALPEGVTALSDAGVDTGSGGTPGTYPGGASGGPTGFAWQYTIDTDGKIASYAITNPGLATATTAPTLTYPSGGVTGATVPVATVGPRILQTSTYWAVASDNQTLKLYSNDGTATPAPVLDTTGAQVAVFVSSGIPGAMQPYVDSAAASAVSAAASSALYGDLKASLSSVTYGRLGIDTVPAYTTDSSGGQTYRNNEQNATAGPAYEFGIWSRAASSATVYLQILDAADILLVEKTLTVAPGLNTFTKAQIEAASPAGILTVPANARFAIYSTTAMFTHTTSASGSGWAQKAGHYASGGGFTNNAAYLQAYLLVEVTGAQTVTATSVAALQAFDTAIIPLFGDNYYLIGPTGTLADTNNAGATAATFVSKVPISQDGTFDGADIFMHAVGTATIKFFSGSNTAGYVLEATATPVAAALGANSFTAAQLGNIQVQAGWFPAIYSTPTLSLAYVNNVSSTGFWQLTGNSTGGTTSSAIGGTIMARLRFKSKGVAATAGRADYDYDASTGSALLAGTAISGIGGVDLMIIGTGQSLSIGYNTDAADPAITTVAEHPGYGLMPNPGVYPNTAPISSFVDLVEATGATTHETPAAGCVSAILERLNARHGRMPRLLYVISGKTGQAYAGGTTTYGSDVKRGSTVYAEIERVVQLNAAVSKAAGRKLIVIAVTLNLGEQDFNDGLSEALFGHALDQHQSNLEEDIRRITGQTQPVPLYTYQTCRAGSTVGAPAGPALAQITTPKRNPKVRCIGPIYYCPQATDGAHVKSRGYRWIGRQYGTFISDDLFGPYLEPLRIISAYWSAANKFCLQYNKALALEADDSKVTISTLGGGLGVDFDDTSADTVTASKSGTTMTVTAITGAINVGDRLVSSGGVAVIVTAFVTGSGGTGTYTVDVSGTVTSTSWTLRRAPTGIAIKSGTTDTIEVTLSGSPTGLRKRAWVAARGPGSGNISGPRSAIRSSVAFDTDPSDGSVLYHWACQEEVVL